MRVLIVGGGRAGRQMLELTRNAADIRVMGLVDVKLDAPGAVLARRLGIPLFSDAVAALQQTGADLVIDLTGRDDVHDQLREQVKAPKELLSGMAARALHAILSGTEEARQHSGAQQTVGELEGSVRALGQANTSVQGSLVKLGEVMRRMQVVSLNAGIEAAKAGVAGKGFGVIAEEMARMTAFATQAVDGVQDAARQTGGALEDLKGIQGRLKEMKV